MTDRNVAKPRYDIEVWWPEPLNRWAKYSVSFTDMQKSFAMGAWSMLRAHVGGYYEQFRLTKDGEVIDTHKTGKLSLN